MGLALALSLTFLFRCLRQSDALRQALQLSEGGGWKGQTSMGFQDILGIFHGFPSYKPYHMPFDKDLNQDWAEKRCRLEMEVLRCGIYCIYGH